MTDFSKFEPYELNEKDIDSTLHYLKIFHPADESLENAITMLEVMHASVHKIRHDNPDSLEPYYEAMMKKKII